MNELQEKIIKEMGVKPTINASEEIEKSIKFIKAYFMKHPFLKTSVLGISGGQDSTLVGKLAQMAMEELRLETGNSDYQFIAVVLPYGQQQDGSDVEDAMSWIRPDIRIDVNIKDSVDTLVEVMEENEKIRISDFNKGNIKARTRMMVQFALAGDHQGIVLGTDHAAENMVGFFTKFGDGAADLMPIFRLNKRQGQILLEELGAPRHLIYKIPTADLEDGQPMQADEDVLGVSYQAIDDYLEGKKIEDNDRMTIEKLYNNSKHKRHLPITIFDDFWKE